MGAAPKRPALANGRVRYVGEAIACIVADTLAQAKDAAELIGFDYDDLELHVDPAPGGTAIHPEAPDNLAFDWGQGDREATEAAFQAAAHHVTARIADNRIITNSMEPRGGLCGMEGRPGASFVWRAGRLGDEGRCWRRRMVSIPSGCGSPTPMSVAVSA